MPGQPCRHKVGPTHREHLPSMEVLGTKESLQDDGTTATTEITRWTLLGLSVDNFFKVWARHGAPAVLQCELYLQHNVAIAHVVTQGNHQWPPPGVTNTFAVPQTIIRLALKLLGKARTCVSNKGWRVFDGDVDLRTASGRPKGAIDGTADKYDDLESLALVEVKVRSLSAPPQQVVTLCNTLDQRWSNYEIPRLKVYRQ